MILRSLFCFLVLATALSVRKDPTDFKSFATEFVGLYGKAGIPELDYDYREYFKSIPAIAKLNEQEAFFTQAKTVLEKYRRKKLSPADQTVFDHIEYETEFNLLRIALEKKWVNDGRIVPENGLHALPNYKEWYTFFIKRYTSTNISPEEVYQMGLKEVKRVKAQVEQIRNETGFKDSASFHAYLKNEKFIIRDKSILLKEFTRIDSTVRKNLENFFGKLEIPEVFAMEWPGANAFTPPGMYLNHRSNAYGKDVFQFNFFEERYNSRAMEWLYMHEAIPGHHLQSLFREPQPGTVQSLFLYPGNFEGWACCMEYYGKEMGLFKDPYSHLGKWEWDLVRSARLVIDAGIHYYGWTKEEALAYWKKTIPGQDEIAEREITRVTNWCGQALSYKVGAAFIETLKADWTMKNPKKKKAAFYLAFLREGNLPLLVLEKKMKR